MNTMRDYLHHALRDAGRVEVRQIETGQIRSGVYDNLSALEDAVAAIADNSTVYTTLNAPKLHQAENAMTGRALTDADIGHVVRLSVDFDTVRPAGVNASDAEVAAAEARRDLFVATMRTEGFPMPLLGMSGNGAHALYRCRLPASEMLRDMLAAIYTALRIEYSDAAVTFDPRCATSRASGGYTGPRIASIRQPRAVPHPGALGVRQPTGARPLRQHVCRGIVSSDAMGYALRPQCSAVQLNWT